MASMINEELEAAKAAEAAINDVLRAPSKSVAAATLKKAHQIAILNLSSGGALNDARAKVGIALSNLMHGIPTDEKIDKAKLAIDVWIRQLEAAKL
jgi:hypothetical protein